MNLQDKMKLALVRFLDSGDKASLEDIINTYPEGFGSLRKDYPDCHRILDFSVGGQNYRVCRQISADEEIILLTVDEISSVLGVPLWLTGEKLRSWAKTEEENPSDEPTDWKNYQ